MRRYRAVSHAHLNAAQESSARRGSARGGRDRGIARDAIVDRSGASRDKFSPRRAAIDTEIGRRAEIAIVKSWLLIDESRTVLESNNEPT
jgi:hypothetical protein